jgi:nitrogen fixation protein NifB
MSRACESRASIQGHPCFGGNHRNNGRIHLPVAPRCNIKCRFCTRRHDCANESRPGVTSRILTPMEALERVREVMASPLLGPVIRVVGIAGPGDPLANEATFETFQLVGKEFRAIIKCLSTNGLLLPEKIDRLENLGLGSLTVTINAIDPEIGGRIYAWIRHNGVSFKGAEGAALLVRNQLEGVLLAAARGITVKINSVLIPGVNEGEMEKIAREVKGRGAQIMNIIPLIPQADFAAVAPPTSEEVAAIRKTTGQIINQFSHCRRCRADAVGLLS